MGSGSLMVGCSACAQTVLVSRTRLAEATGRRSTWTRCRIRRCGVCEVSWRAIAASDSDSDDHITWNRAC